MKMFETPFFFPNGNYRLFGVLHEALQPAKKEGFVFCAPFGEEMLWAHRLFVNFARELARRGYPVLRFDYMGNGDSEGDFEECSVETKISDILCAMRILKGKACKIESVGLIGLRFGATLALLAASNKEDVKKLILWEPIIDCSAYMRELLRINLATQTSVYKEIRENTDTLISRMKVGKTVNIEGYEMSWEFYKQSIGVSLLEEKKPMPAPTLLINIVKKPGAISQAFKTLTLSLPSATFLQVQEEPFWKEIRQYYPRGHNLFSETLSWLEDQPCLK
jgi:exosortase A-associated hydrolase 2